MSAERKCRHPEGAFHDCRYVDARNRLIPQALLEAERAGHAFEGPARDQEVARAFMAAMERLARERGLTGRGPSVASLALGREVIRPLMLADIREELEMNGHAYEWLKTGDA